MKRRITALMALIALAALCLSACGSVKLDSASMSSRLFTRSEIVAASKALEETVAQLKADGCTIYGFSYAGDDICRSELEYINSLRDDGEDMYSACVVFNSRFHSPKSDDSAYNGWTPDTEYTWDFFVGCKPDGTWKLVTFGY